MNEENLRFWNLEHAKTINHKNNDTEIILKAEFEPEFKKKYNNIWVSIYCQSPGSYSYSIDGDKEDVRDVELNTDEKILIDHFVSKNNLIIDECDVSIDEMSEEDRYHWGLDYDE